MSAIFSGKVVFSDWLRGYGLLIIIDHGQGVLSLYGYNESIENAVGDTVVAGERIGISGSDDRNKVGSYFGMRVNGQPVNPEKWLKKTSNKG